jgi:hypothetical protein
MDGTCLPPSFDFPKDLSRIGQACLSISLVVVNLDGIALTIDARFVVAVFSFQQTCPDHSSAFILRACAAGTPPYIKMAMILQLA